MNQEYQMYRIQPQENWKFVKFYKNKVKIDDEEYWFRDFINCGKFRIHDVVVMNQKGENVWETLIHVWYESIED